LFGLSAGGRLSRIFHPKPTHYFILFNIYKPFRKVEAEQIWYISILWMIASQDERWNCTSSDQSLSLLSCPVIYFTESMDWRVMPILVGTSMRHQGIEIILYAPSKCANKKITFWPKTDRPKICTLWSLRALWWHEKTAKNAKGSNKIQKVL